MRHSRGRLRWLLKALFVLVALAALVLVAWMIVTGPVAVLRILRYGDTTVYDFQHYPARSMRASQEPFAFQEDPNASLLFETGRFGEGSLDLDQFLLANDSLAFVVVKNENLLFEGYYQGHGPEAYSQLFSVSKSILAGLIGAAVADGHIRSVEQPVTDFVPELVENGFDRVTIQHLLQMKSGSNYVENDNPFGVHVRMNYTPALEQEILRFRVIDPPGMHFRYKSGDNALLALILERSLGTKTLTEYTQARLWDPVGMAAGGMWSLDQAPDGLEKTWCCLAATALDLARYGRLFLHNGNLDGEQILPAEWVAASTQVGAVPARDWPDSFRQIGLENYGYHWWLVEQERGDFLALGKDGQFLYVDPQTQVIIVRLGESLGEIGTQGWIALFRELAETVGESFQQ